MEAIAQQDNLSLEQERALVYGLLGSLLRGAPGRDQLTHLASLEVAEDQPGSDTWRLLKMAAAQADAGALAQEYQDLFVGIGRGELVPYGSWYQTGFLMERPLLMLRQDLERLGYQRESEIKEPEDHAAALCEVMGFAIQDGLCAQTQKTFFAQHLSPWMGRFFHDLQAAKGATFYRAVGHLGALFIDLEQDYLGVAD